ncbi:MAG: response regulator [Spartobacteria bacterium]|nr:response regulator [Spartobacteria bacterium]
MELDSTHIENFIRGAYILAVDDFSIMRRLLVTTLRAKEAYVDEAEDGSVALEKIKLAQENDVPYDLVFLDIEMPILDGISFLKELRKDPQIKDTRVIVLSSHADQEEINDCISQGITDYIIKPVTKERLYQAVSKALSDRVASSSPPKAAASARGGGRTGLGAKAGFEENYSKSIFQKLETIDTLPSLPVVLEKIRAMTKDPNVDNEKIAGIMKDDPSLMTNVLKMANSALYGARERIETLQSAITRLGMNAVNNLATSMAIISFIADSKQEGFDHKEFCRHSISTGIAMCVLNDRCREHLTSEFSKDFLHLCGLLHDIGKIIIMQFFPNEFNKSMMLGKKHSIPLFISEQMALGITHAEVGAWLGKKWNLPNTHLNCIRYHHSPLLTDSKHTDLVALAHGANYICNLESIGDSGDTQTPLFDKRTFASLGLKVGDIQEITEEIKKQSKMSQVLLSFL